MNNVDSALRGRSSGHWRGFRSDTMLYTYLKTGLPFGATERRVRLRIGTARSLLAIHIGRPLRVIGRGIMGFITHKGVTFISATKWIVQRQLRSTGHSVS